MYNQEDYVFWRLAYFLIAEQEYRIIQLFKDQKELWLEKTENKQARVIRLHKVNLDWSNYLQRDIELTAYNGEKIRKQMRGEINVLNIYVTAYPPVDDYQFRIEKPFVHSQSSKTSVTTVIMDRQNKDQALEKLGNIFGREIPLPEKEDFEDSEIEKIKHLTLTTAVNKINAEKKMFEYGKPLFTYVFVAIQVILFFIMEFFGGSTNTATLIRFGAKFNPLILEGEWWRFITPIFLHIGVLHLLMNTVALFYLGSEVEKIYGRLRFVLIYLIAGFTGVLASFVFSPNLSAGASGAIFGCFGALLYFGVIYPKLFMRTMGMNVFIVLGINLAFGFSMQGIDNAGHIGGLIGGFLATGILHFPKKKKWLMQVSFLIATVLISSGMLYYSFHNSAQSVVFKAQRFINLEQWNKAESILEQYEEKNQSSAEVYFLLSIVEIKKNEIELAQNHLLQAIKLKPDFHEAHFNLALIYFNQQQVKQAKEHLKKAIEIQPNKKEYKEFLKKID